LTRKTPFETRASILSELFMKYRKDETFKEFREYANLGLPLAYAISTGVVPSTDKAQELVDDAFEGLLEILEIAEDEGFKDLDDLLAESSWDIK
jgi:hypothetical protein